MSNRGIIGNKPKSGASQYSDVFGFDTQYVASVDGVIYPSANTAASSGFAIANTGGFARPTNNHHIYFKEDGSWDMFKVVGQQSGATLAGGNYVVTATPGGDYITFLEYTTTDFFTTYEKSGAKGRTYTQVSRVAAPTTGQKAYIEYNPAGTILAVAGPGTPYIYLYQRSGSTLTQLSNPDILPTGSMQSSGPANCLSWSPDGQYLAMAHNVTPFFTVWKVSGTTFTKIANPTSLPSAAGVTVAWNHDGTSLALVNNANLYVYNRTGDTLTLASTTAIGLNPGSSQLSWNYNSTLILITGGVSPYYWIFQRSGNTVTSAGITLSPAPPVTSITMGTFCKEPYNSSGASLLVFVMGTVNFYSISGTTGTQVYHLGTAPGFNNNDVTDNGDVSSRHVCFIYK